MGENSRVINKVFSKLKYFEADFFFGEVKIREGDGWGVAKQ
jgi:hypothetical protein